MFAGKHSREFHPVDFLFKGGKQSPDFGKRLLVVTLFAQLDQDQEVVQFLASLIPIFDHLLDGRALFQNSLSAFVVVPEIRVGSFGIEFGNAFPLGIDVKDTPSAHRAFLC